MISPIKSIYFENVTINSVKLSQEKLEDYELKNNFLSSNNNDTVSISSDGKVEFYKNYLTAYGKGIMSFLGKSYLSFKFLGKAYANCYNNIIENVSEEEQESYIKELDKAFDEIINDKSQEMVSSIEKGLNAAFFGDEVEEVSLEEYNLDDFITKVFNEAKEFYLKDNDGNLGDYLSTKFTKLNSSFSYDELSLMLDFADLYNNSMKNISLKINDITGNGYKYYSELSENDFNNFASEIDSIVNRYGSDSWTELRNRFENSTLDSKLKDKFINAIDRIKEYSSYITGKMDQYKQNLETYRNLLEQLEKLQLYIDKMMSKASSSKKEENMDMYKMYLNKALEYQKKMAEIQGKIAKAESKLKKLEDEMSEPKIEIEEV